MRNAGLSYMGIALALCLPASTLHAQTARSGSAANPQAVQQLQQLASERTALQAENAKIKADLEQARRERDTLKTVQAGIAARSRGAEAELAKAQAENARLEGELARAREREKELVARFRESAATMREVETDRAAKVQLLAQREQELGVCVDRNRKLIALNGEILDKLEDQGFWSSLAGREPFTRLKRTQLENLADGYRDAAQDQRFAPGSPAKP